MIKWLFINAIAVTRVLIERLLGPRKIENKLALPDTFDQRHQETDSRSLSLPPPPPRPQN